MSAKRINWTKLVQVLITDTATGKAITDKTVVRSTLARVVERATYRREIEDCGDGCWLVDLPTEIYAQVEDGGELTLNVHATGATVEIAA